MLLHREHANAAGLDGNGTHDSNCSGDGPEMNDITDVEDPYLTVVEPDYQPTVHIHVGCLTENVHGARQFNADPSADRL